jgi:alanine racemase
MTTPQRWAWAEINLAAVAHNIRALAAMAAPSELWAVVKADGYGHGAVRVGQAALAAGAAGLCVALTQEGVELRSAGITAPILVLSEQPADNTAALIANGLTPTVYSVAGVAALAAAVAAGERPYPVHVKVDTGMHRVGVAPADLAALLQQLSLVSDRLRVDAIFTHLAVADDPSNDYNLVSSPVSSQCFCRVLMSVRTPPTPPDSWLTRRRVVTWCVAASRSTASRPARVWMICPQSFNRCLPSRQG